MALLELSVSLKANRKTIMLLFYQVKNTFPKLVRINNILLFYGLLLFNKARSQPGSASDAALAEKIYIQPDNKVYTTDQTIWFKATTCEFYAPKYGQLKPEDWRKPDKRTLLHWEPDFKSDSTGRQNLSFYNADATGKIHVVVEAISESGESGYQEFYYDVKKRE
jgi:hypothetical protein